VPAGREQHVVQVMDLAALLRRLRVSGQGFDEFDEFDEFDGFVEAEGSAFSQCSLVEACFVDRSEDSVAGHPCCVDGAVDGGGDLGVAEREEWLHHGPQSRRDENGRLGSAAASDEFNQIGDEFLWPCVGHRDAEHQAESSSLDLVGADIACPSSGLR
jgi:hypothetical protein